MFINTIQFTSTYPTSQVHQRQTYREKLDSVYFSGSTSQKDSLIQRLLFRRTKSSSSHNASQPLDSIPSTPADYQNASRQYENALDAAKQNKEMQEQNRKKTESLGTDRQAKLVQEMANKMHDARPEGYAPAGTDSAFQQNLNKIKSFSSR